MFRDMKNIYDCLCDDRSKHIFMARMQYAATLDLQYFTKIPALYRNLGADVEYFCRKYQGIKNKVVIFGAGANGRRLVAGFTEISVVAFIDNYVYQQHATISGIKVYKPENYIKTYGIEDTTFVISVNNTEVKRTMKQQLQEYGIVQSNILEAPPDWRNNESQYFDFFAPAKKEVFADCGCYDGATTLRFAAWCGEQGYEAIHAFEADSRSFLLCKENLDGLHNCTVYPYGVSDIHRKALFLTNGQESARIVVSEENETEECAVIETVSLDKQLKNEHITFMKLDIEGAELDALHGAEKIINKWKPKCAISVYHKLEDFIEIPKFLLSVRPDYKLCMRQYSLFEDETILYAW